MKLPRPKLPKPKLPKPKLPKPKLPKPKLSKPKLPRPKLPRRKPKAAKAKKAPERDLWFRFSTRLRAIGYWIREKAQQAWRLLRRAALWLAGLWTSRSKETRIRIGAVAGVLVLYAVIKFAPVPGVPCQISAYRECPPPNETFAQVPADALLYAQLTLDEDSFQYERARELAEDLPDLALVGQQLGSTLPTPSGSPVEVAADVLPWADRELAVARLPQPQGATASVFIAGVGDRAGADAFLAKIAPPGPPQPQEVAGATMNVHPGGFAASFAEDSLLFGAEAAVRATLEAGTEDRPTLEDADPANARDDLPEARFAEVYLSREGVQRFLAQGGRASQLETFVDYGATAGIAAAARARDDGIELELVSRLDPKLAEKSPSFFSGLPRFEPELTGEVGPRALGYVGIGDIGPSLTELLARAGEAGLGASLKNLAARLQKEAGVDPLAELLPALGGEAALSAEPTDGVPYASLIVDDVDEGKANDALARLQGPLLRSLNPGAGAQVPRFEESEVEGVTVRSLQVSPTVNVSYAVFDGMLVISTDPEGIAQVRRDGDGLKGAEPFKRATDDLPGDVSALVFLNLDELLGLAEQAGLAEDPLYASLRNDISKIGSTGLAVTASDEQIQTEMFLVIDP